MPQRREGTTDGSYRRRCFFADQSSSYSGNEGSGGQKPLPVTRGLAELKAAIR